MTKKDFKISYQSVITGVPYLITFVILWIIVEKYMFEYWNNSITQFWKASSSFELTFLLLIIIGVMVFGICLVYSIVKGIVKRYRSDDKWHDGLTYSTIYIPLTYGQYNSIKNNQIFFTKYERDGKPVYDSGKLNTWAEKIIENELKRLK